MSHRLVRLEFLGFWFVLQSFWCVHRKIGIYAGGAGWYRSFWVSVVVSFYCQKGILLSWWGWPWQMRQGKWWQRLHCSTYESGSYETWKVGGDLSLTIAGSIKLLCEWFLFLFKGSESFIDFFFVFHFSNFLLEVFVFSHFDLSFRLKSIDLVF